MATFCKCHTKTNAVQKRYLLTVQAGHGISAIVLDQIYLVTSDRLKSLVVIRPALLTDGTYRVDQTTSGKDAYRVSVGDVEGSWTISRKDVAHFLVEGVAKQWDNWEGKCVRIAY